MRWTVVVILLSLIVSSLLATVRSTAAHGMSQQDIEQHNAEMREQSKVVNVVRL